MLLFLSVTSPFVNHGLLLVPHLSTLGLSDLQFTL